MSVLFSSRIYWRWYRNRQKQRTRLQSFCQTAHRSHGIGSHVGVAKIAIWSKLDCAIADWSFRILCFCVHYDRSYCYTNVSGQSTRSSCPSPPQSKLLPLTAPDWRGYCPVVTSCMCMSRIRIRYATRNDGLRFAVAYFWSWLDRK